MIRNERYSTSSRSQGHWLFLLEDLVISFVQLIIADVCVSLRDLDIAMPRQFLREFEVAGTAQDGGNEVVSEGVGRDLLPTVSSPRISRTRSVTMLRPVVVVTGLIFLPAPLS